jgi:hypothetical protein
MALLLLSGGDDGDDDCMGNKHGRAPATIYSDLG